MPMNRQHANKPDELTHGAVYLRVHEMALNRGVVSRTGATPGQPSNSLNRPSPSPTPSLDPHGPIPFELIPEALAVLDTREPQPTAQWSVRRGSVPHGTTL